jgi:hypothetical protein
MTINRHRPDLSRLNRPLAPAVSRRLLGLTCYRRKNGFEKAFLADVEAFPEPGELNAICE